MQFIRDPRQQGAEPTKMIKTLLFKMGIELCEHCLSPATTIVIGQDIGLCEDHYNDVRDRPIEFKDEE